MRTFSRRFLALAAAALCCAGVLLPAAALADEADLMTTDAGLLSTQADNIATGSWGECAWEISADGTLTVHPGVVGSYMTDERWCTHATQIKKVVFAEEGGKKVVASSCYELLKDLGSVESVDLSGLDTSIVANMAFMFEGCSSLKSLDLSPLNTSSVTAMGYMFSGCSALTSLDVSTLDTSSVKDMNCMFGGCASLESLDVSKFKTSNVMTMVGMFSSCLSLKTLDIRGIDTLNVMDMSHMFEGCSALTSLDVSGFDTQAVYNMNSMFEECTSLTSLNVSGRFSTRGVANIVDMFRNCSALTSLDLSSFVTTGVSDADNVLDGCSSLERLTLGENVKVFAMPTIEVNGHTDWLSEAEGKWFTSDQINESRLGIADTYTKPRPEGGGESGGESGGEGGGESGGEGGQEVDPNADLLAYAGVAASSGHPDLIEGEWYMTVSEGAFPGTNVLYLDYTLGRGLMSGYDDGSNRFDPWGEMNRGMAITVIYRMATGATAANTNNNVEAPFVDVHPGDWYAAAVKWGYENGITTGYEDGSGRFGPLDLITREQLVTMIARYCESKGMAASDKNVSMFNDAGAISEWALDGVAFCYAHQIVSGMGNTGNFAPSQVALRAQMSKIIAVTARMLDKRS